MENGPPDPAGGVWVWIVLTIVSVLLAIGAGYLVWARNNRSRNHERIEGQRNPRLGDGGQLASFTPPPVAPLAPTAPTAPAPTAPAPTVPSAGGDDRAHIGEYRILTMLGKGGMGEVYLVQHPRLPRQDALKLLDATVSHNEQFCSRFKREADLLAPLRHPNIITIYDRGESDGRLWLTMEYVDGLDAARLLRNAGALPLDLVLQIIGGAGAALDYAYAEHHITHRDVKPANILIAFSQSGKPKSVKLADFGIAKAAGESTSLTSTGITIGTMAYMSPEAIEGRELDNRADIYSLGCSAFELLTGSVPFAAPTIPALMLAHLTQPIPSVTERNPQLPERLNEVFARVLAKNAGNRYSSCEEYVEAVREVDAAR